MVDLLDNFQDLIKLFLALASNFIKSLEGEWEGVRRKKKRRIVYRRSGERSAEKAESKVFLNREGYKTYFIKKAVRPT